MKLFCTPNSPFSRMARVAVIELQLDKKVEVVFVTVRDAKSELLKHEPVGKVPALLVESGLVFTDTHMVIETLECVSNAQKLNALPNELDHFAFEGMCLGFLESLCVWVREARRPEALVSSDLIAVETARALRCLQYLEINVDKLTPEFGTAAIAVACAIDISRRLKMIDVAAFPELKAWYDVVIMRESMTGTEPKFK